MKVVRKLLRQDQRPKVGALLRTTPRSVQQRRPVKMMRLKAPQGAVLHLRASGEGANEAAAAIIALIEARFPEAAESAAHD